MRIFPASGQFYVPQFYTSNPKKSSVFGTIIGSITRKYRAMKNLFAAAIFGLMFISCDKTECLEGPCNEGVPMSYIPVCGCNDITYPNKETAECHGIINYRSGECDE